MARRTAVLLANGLLQTPFAKTTYGLLRGPSRYTVAAVVDPLTAGMDAGEILDGRIRGVPVLDSLASALDLLDPPPAICVVGVATVGGLLPAEIRADLLDAARNGMTLVNGMHQLLEDDRELVTLTRQNGGSIIDIRKPKPIGEMRFWQGEILHQHSTRIAVLGIDCAVGKRTTAVLLWRACRQAGITTEMIYTGQTGWLQGFEHGFVLDATPNDYVCGELEQALLRCHRDHDPDLVLIEGQSGLQNPSGPCGSELILGGAAAGVVLQHVPGRRYFEGLEDQQLELPSIDSEIALIESLGVPVLALTLNHEGASTSEANKNQANLRDRLSIPVVDPLVDGVEPVVAAIAANMETTNR